MHDNDVPGYLMDALASAKSRGLHKLTVFFIGTKGSMWQVSSMFETSKGYYVVRDDSLEQALLRALGAQPQRTELPAVGLFD